MSTQLQAGPGSGSELGTPASGVLHAAERDGLAAPSVDWQLGALAEEVRQPDSSALCAAGAHQWISQTACTGPLRPASATCINHLTNQQADKSPHGGPARRSVRRRVWGRPPCCRRRRGWPSCASRPAPLPTLHSGAPSATCMLRRGQSSSGEDRPHHLHGTVPRLLTTDDPCEVLVCRLGRGAKLPSRFGQDEATLSWLSPMRLPANGSASRPGSPDGNLGHLL
jgi:hypothetical protein